MNQCMPGEHFLNGDPSARRVDAGGWTRQIDRESLFLFRQREDHVPAQFLELGHIRGHGKRTRA